MHEQGDAQLAGIATRPSQLVRHYPRNTLRQH
jgi:hypothetical protein